MTRFLSISYVLVIVFIFLYSLVKHKSRVILYKKYKNLKPNLGLAFLKTGVVFVGEDANVYVVKNDFNCIDFGDKKALILQFCEENFAPFLLINEQFMCDSIVRNYALNGLQLFVKCEKGALHSTFFVSKKTKFNLRFLKWGDFLIKKATKKCGFWILAHDKKIGIFIEDATAKTFVNTEDFGFCVELEKDNEAHLIFEGLNVNAVSEHKRKNLLIQKFGLPSFEGVLPNFDMLFFNNQPLKQNFAKCFLQNKDYNLCFDFVGKIAKLHDFTVFEPEKEFFISLTDMGLTKLLNIKKRKNVISVFDALSKLKIMFIFSEYVVFSALRCFLGDVLLYVKCSEKAIFHVELWGYDLNALVSECAIDCDKNLYKILNFDFTSDICGIFMVLNKAVLMGNAKLNKTQVAKINSLILTKEQQKAFSNLILSYLTVSKEQNLLKNQSICKLLLKNCDYSSDEFNYLYLKKVQPFIRSEKINRRIMEMLKNGVPKQFCTFEGVFCYDFGLNVNLNNLVKQVTIKPSCANSTIGCNICRKECKIGFSTNDSFVFNKCRHFGNTTIII